MAYSERPLRLQIADEVVDVPVRIFSPIDTGSSWECRWEIHWPDRVRSSAAGGADAIQALVCALQIVGAELYTSDEHKAGRLMWSEPGKGYGFPVGQIIRDLLEGDDARFL